MCENSDCSLHLNSFSSEKFGPFYGAKEATGVLIATGNVGDYLSVRKDEVNTYLSRDGGLTWNEIIKGSTMYEIGDHGGLIVAADDQEATNHVHYTWDEGLTFEKFKFSDSLVEVDNIIVEPLNSDTSFVLHGRLKGTKTHVLVNLDFASLH